MSCSDYAKLGKYLNIMMPVTKADLNKHYGPDSGLMEGYSTETLNSKGYNKSYNDEFAMNYSYGVKDAKTSMAQVSDPCYFKNGPFSKFVPGTNNNETCNQNIPGGKFVCGSCTIPGSEQVEKQPISIGMPCDRYKVTGSSNGVLMGSCGVIRENITLPTIPSPTTTTPSCTNGKILLKGNCVCPGGTEMSSDGKCSSCGTVTNGYGSIFYSVDGGKCTQCPGGLYAGKDGKQVYDYGTTCVCPNGGRFNQGTSFTRDGVFKNKNGSLMCS